MSQWNKGFKSNMFSAQKYDVLTWDKRLCLCLCPDSPHPAGGCICMLTCTCRITDNNRNHSQPTTHLSAFVVGTTHRLRARSHTAETYKSRSTDKNECTCIFSLTKVYLSFCSIIEYMHEYNNIHKIVWNNSNNGHRKHKFIIYHFPWH